jgi:hypothetical protein
MGNEDSKWLDIIAEYAVGAWVGWPKEGLLHTCPSWVILGNKAAWTFSQIP